MWTAIPEIALATRCKFGNESLAWFPELPLRTTQEAFGLVHATPESCLRTPSPEATDAELEAIYGSLGKPVVVVGHIHRPSIRTFAGQPRTLINTGSVGLSYDGDPRASYLIIEGSTPSIRRVEYDVDKELRALAACGLPGAEWTARMLRTSSPQMP